MSHNLDSYRKNAIAARAEAKATSLPNVRARATEAAAKWEDMAEELESVEAQREIRLGAVIRRVGAHHG